MNGNLLTFNGRLPGVLCETSVPPARENPLRLDVAGFVGFAERGPLHTPVMIEDLSQYQLIFGQDLPLAVDKGLPVYAHLPTAVEAFFENGGQRCYVVRVAGAMGRANRFYLPGLLQPDASGQWQPIQLPAAWVGSWSDFVRVGTSLHSQPLKIRNDEEAVHMRGVDILQGIFALPLRVPAANSVRPGDLLRLQIEQPVAASHSVYMQVGAVEVEPTVASSLLGSPILVGAVANSIRIFDNRPSHRNYNLLDRLSAQGWQRLPFDQSDIRWELPDPLDGGGPYRLSLPLVSDVKIAEGELLRLQVGGEPTATFLTVERVSREQDAENLGQIRLVIDSAQPLLEQPTLNAERWTLVQVDLLTFDLAIREGEETLEQWINLHFGPGDGYWRNVLAQAIDRSQIEPPAFRIDHFTSRSLRIGQGENRSDALIYPLGISPITQQFGPRSEMNAVGKDGLDHYDPLTLFTDQAFPLVTARNVLTVANDLLYTGPTPRRLNGMHSLLPVQEVALIALPDLAHRGWEPLLTPPFILPEPPIPEDKPPQGFHDCPAREPVPPEKEMCAAMPVLILDGSELPAEPNIQATLENLPDALAPDAYDEESLLTVQRSLVRLCAAQADRMAILALPRHYQGRLVEQWQQQLVTTPDFLDGSALSYAASYHGWVGVRETATPALAPLRYMPPDGAVCGLIAAREIARGAWIAPANQPLRTVSDLAPNFSNGEWLALYNHQINVIRQQPGRYALMSALTLSRDRLLTQISVRRLLIFLRKLALREGQRYVFESNHERFRLSVQTYFERILAQLLERGGIQAFQVVTNEEVNTPNDTDNGRFVIALKVAPTSPIEFITVIMLRSGDDGIDILEI